MNRLIIFGIVTLASVFMAVSGFGKMGGSYFPGYPGYSVGFGAGGGGGAGYNGIWSFLVFSKIMKFTINVYSINFYFGWFVVLRQPYCTQNDQNTIEFWSFRVQRD